MKAFRVAAGLLLSVLGVYAAPLINEPVKELKLASGVVLYDAQAKSFGEKVVMVKHRDGGQTVPYEQFPEEYRAALLEKKAKPSPVSVRTNVVPAPKTAAPKVTSRDAEPKRVTGQIINSYDVRPSYTRVEIYNGSDRPVSVHPSSVVGERSDGKIASGRQWVAVDASDNISMTLDQTQVVGPNDVLTLRVVFERIPQDVSIVKVGLR